ncbi:C40 family peptidase [Candidatus Gracilibacteria bacterium]|nr:C40 family peptidase [Candidatus Gracilibacteria bacterium]MCF7856764.1 C40 family peptidase [Candidatus Gracilibacteria bacterium]MCF7897054.1 C40 family peptidase [Candidatus Gracilibacteria bacterium]
MSTRQRPNKPLGWGKPTRPVVDIFRRPLDNFERLTDTAKTRNRQTQITTEDLPFQLLAEDEKWTLIGLADGTFGWIYKKFVDKIKTANYWEKVHIMPRHKTLILPSPTAPAKIKAILGRFKGTPYLWGGTTRQGMDCSAFIQKLFSELFGILLPRNSREQKKCGCFVYSRELCPLDILFFVHLPTGRQARQTGRHHVGVYFDDLIWHFCLDKKGLSTETLVELKKRYRYLTARRIVKIEKC